jgi:hypothetical protein
MARCERRAVARGTLTGGRFDAGNAGTGLEGLSYKGG